MKDLSQKICYSKNREKQKEGGISIEKNRSHGKVDKLPEEIRKEVENRLLEGHTYKEIANYLKEMGHNISKTSIHRYGKPFLQKFESVRLAKEFAQLLAEDNIERPTTELHEANNALISQMIMEALISDKVEQQTKLDAARSIATLQRAQVQNERLKLNARKEAGAVHTALKRLKQQVYEEIGKHHPEVAKEIIKIADDIEKETDK